MSDKTKIFLGVVYEHEGKYGKYLTGPFGAAGRLYIQPSKDDPKKWTMHIVENEKRDDKPKQTQPAPAQKQDAFTHSEDDQIPF